jgi:hypothetical protein
MTVKMMAADQTVLSAGQFRACIDEYRTSDDVVVWQMSANMKNPGGADSQIQIATLSKTVSASVISMITFVNARTSCRLSASHSYLGGSEHLP